MAGEIQRLTGGVDVYFDNVGGWITDAVIPLIKRRARIVICGAISQYDGGLDRPDTGPRLLQHMLFQRATIQGILARDYLHRVDEMKAIVAPWVKNGDIVFEETIVDGFEQPAGGTEQSVQRPESRQAPGPIVNSGPHRNTSVTAS